MSFWCQHIDRSAEADLKARQQLAQQGRLVVRRIALQLREVDRHLLQAEHVEIGHLARTVQHARQIDHAVQAAEPLHVPGDQVHGCGR
jgi:hypothetical protein